jgi:hypothetical protein
MKNSIRSTDQHLNSIKVLEMKKIMKFNLEDQ